MSREETQFNSKTGKEGGEKSKRGPSLKTALKNLFEKEIKENGNLTPQNFVKACLMHGIKGNSGMAKLLWEYNDGKPDQKIDIDINADSKPEKNIDPEEEKLIEEEVENILSMQINLKKLSGKKKKDNK